MQVLEPHPYTGILFQAFSVGRTMAFVTAVLSICRLWNDFCSNDSGLTNTDERQAGMFALLPSLTVDQHCWWS